MSLRTVIPVLIVFALVFPQIAFAANSSFFGPILPDVCRCEGVEGENGIVLNTAPEWGCILQTGNNLVSFAVSIGVIVFILVIIYAGILFMASPFKAENRELGRSIIMNAFVGMAIALSAWILIDFIMKTVYKGSQNQEDPQFGPWNDLLLGNEESYCIQPRVTPTDDPIAPGGGAPIPNAENPEGTVSVDGACPGTSCVQLEPQVNCEASGCQVASALKTALQSIGSLSTWTVTEAYPSSMRHAAACHRNGTCVDVAFRPQNYSALPDGNVVRFVRAAESAGLRVVFEVAEGGRPPNNACPKRDAARVQGVTAYCKSDGGGYERITGTHFSVYSR